MAKQFPSRGQFSWFLQVQFLASGGGGDVCGQLRPMSRLSVQVGIVTLIGDSATVGPCFCWKVCEIDTNVRSA